MKKKSVDNKLHTIAKKNKVIPMGDDNIKKYFPDAKIIRYCDLKNVRDINALLPNDKSYFFVLYQNSPHAGHWCCVNKFKNKIEFFDSYGGKCDTQLDYISPNENYELGIDAPYLSNLIYKSGYNLVSNKKKYQETNENNISTCGRHCCFRIMNLLEKDRNLNDYKKIMDQTKKNMKTSYDKIVSAFIQD